MDQMFGSNIKTDALRIDARIHGYWFRSLRQFSWKWLRIWHSHLPWFVSIRSGTVALLTLWSRWCQKCCVSAESTEKSVIRCWTRRFFLGRSKRAFSRAPPHRIDAGYWPMIMFRCVSNKYNLKRVNHSTLCPVIMGQCKKMDTVYAIDLQNKTFTEWFVAIFIDANTLAVQKNPHTHTRIMAHIIERWKMREKNCLQSECISAGSIGCLTSFSVWPCAQNAHFIASNCITDE